MTKKDLLASITPVEPLAHSKVGVTILYNPHHPTYVCNCCIPLAPIPETVKTHDLTIATASQVDARCVRCWQFIKFTQTELDQLKARLDQIKTGMSNQPTHARLLETGDIREVIRIDHNFEGDGLAYCLKMTSEDMIVLGLNELEWYSGNLVEPLYLPYTCISCSKQLDFPHTFFYQGLTYCSVCLSEYDKHQQW